MRHRTLGKPVWFEEDPWFGRRRPGRNRRWRLPRPPILKADLCLDRDRAQQTRRLTALLMALGATTAAVILSYVGFSRMEEYLFASNPDFILRHLDIRTDSGGILTPELMREYLGIAEGDNLFQTNIVRLRSELLHRVPNLRDVEITRILPDTLRVEVRERVPLALIQFSRSRNPDVFVDEEGRIFAARARREGLPVIRVRNGPSVCLGDWVDGLLRDAVLVLDTARTSAAASELHIRAIDVVGRSRGREDVLQLHIDGTVVDFWWPRPPNDPQRGLQALKDRLIFLAGILRRARRDGRSLERINLTLDSLVAAGRWHE